MTTSTATDERRIALARIVPSVLLTARRPQRMVERTIMWYRHAWMIAVSGFFEPLLYLLSVKVGFAALVGTITIDGEVYDYAKFVAPGLLAAAAMNGTLFEATGNVFAKLKHQKLYDTVLATPMNASDVALGEILGAVARGGVYSVAFVITMWALGLVGSPMIVLAIPVCLLIGFAFAAAGMAYTTTMRNWSDLEYVNVVTLPLMLFSATFYPASSYGQWEWIVQLSPLYHGVVVVRGCNLGELQWSMLGNLGVLVVLALIGLTFTARRIERLLLP